MAERKLSDLILGSDPATGSPAPAAPSASAFLDGDQPAPLPSAAAFLDSPDHEVGLGERFLANFREGHAGTLAGASELYLKGGAAAGQRAANILQAIDAARAAGSDTGIEPQPVFDTLGGTPTMRQDQETAIAPYAGTPISDLIVQRTEQANRQQALRAQAAREELQRQRAFDALPTEGEGITGKLAAVLGYVAGGGATPESLVPVGRAETLLGTFGRGAAVNAATTAAADPVVQQERVAAGVQKEVDPYQTLVSAALGGLIGGAVNVAPDVAKALLGKVAAVLKKPVEQVTPADVQATAYHPDVKAILEANGIALDSPQATEAGGEIARRLQARQEARQALATPEGAKVQADVNLAADAQAEAARAVASKPAEPPPVDLEAERVRQAAVQLPPEVIPARAPPAEGRPPYSTVGQEPDAGTRPGLEAQRAQDASVQRAFDQADLLRRRGQPAAEGRPAGDYAAARAEREAAYAADQHIAELSQRIGEDAPALVERQFGVDHEAFVRMTNDARERLVMAAQRQAAAEAPAGGVLRTSDAALNSEDPGAPYDAASRPQQADRTVSQQPAENPRAPRQPTDTELAAGDRSYARTATGTSDRPFRAEDTGQPTPEQAAGFEQAARDRTAAERAKSEEDLLRQWEARRRADEQMRQRQGGAEQQRRQQEEAAYGGRSREGTFGNQAKPGADQRFETDQFGYVRSTKGGPIRFADQKQAAKWILNVGHKTSPDQVFEIANHPSGKGFTARERGRSEPPPGGEKPGAGAEKTGPQDKPAASEPPAGDTGPARQLPAPAGDAAAEKAAQAVESGGTKLYSNPLDPQAWRELWGPVLRDVAGWAKREIDAWEDDLKHLVAGLKGTSALTPVRLAVDTIRRLWYSNDGVLRALAARYRMPDGSMNPAIDAIRRMFFAPPGQRAYEGVGRTFGEAVEMRSASRINALGKILAPFQAMRRAEMQTALEQIGQKIRTNSARAGTSKIDDAAVAIQKMLRDELAYQRQAGMDIGDVGPNYLPRMLNVDRVLADPRAFQAAAAAAYRADGMSAADADKAAEAWFGRVLDEDMGFRAEHNDFVSLENGSTGTKSEKPRVLGPQADRIMGDFYLHNPAELLPAYLIKSARRAEWVRRMGAQLERWEQLKQQMRDTGAADARADVVRAIQSATGTLSTPSSRGGRMLLAFMRNWSSFTFLAKATLSSLPEPVTAAVRTGNAMDALNAVGLTLRGILSRLPVLRGVGEAIRGEHFETAKALAEDLGAIVEIGNDMLMRQRFGGDIPGQFANAMATRFFSRTGLHQFTEDSRTAVVQIGRLFIRRLAKDVAGNTSRVKSARAMLGELGVPADQIDRFATWVVDHNDGHVLPDDLRAGGEAETYRTAAMRFINQTIMSPKPIEKPLYASHPFGSLFYSLQSWLYSFTKQVLNRVGHTALQAVNPKADYTLGDRMRFLGPAMMFPLLVAANWGVRELRDKLYPDPAKDPNAPPLTPTEKLVRALSATGAAGTLDLPLNVVTGLRYRKDPATVLAGPIFGGISGTLAAGVSLTGKENSPNTNTAERKFSQTIYDNFMLPAMIATFSSLPGVLGDVVGAIGIQAAAAPASREKVVRALAGPPEFKGSGGAGTGRSSGRGGERNSGRSSGR